MQRMGGAPMKNEALAYFILRITLGINILTHGIVRIPHYQGFVDNLVSQFRSVFIPDPVINFFGHLLPPLEIAIGVLLLLGLFTRTAAVAGGLLIAILIFGSSVKQDWNVVGIQMIYALTYFFIIFYMNHNRFSIDNLMWKNYSGSKF